MKAKSLEIFVPAAEGVTSGRPAEASFVVAIRAGRSPAARFLTLNEEWAAMATRALRPQPARPRPF